ncbi:MAG TPA: IS4 family transposase [Candidatus Methylomirabilis sp.]|nr:IS4 family transposase [Candidatus Methylomirabilis sp.]
MPTTPDFAPWAGTFARQLQQWRATRAATLHQFELLAGPWIAHWRLAQQDQGPHSRNRLWNLRLVFWTFLWQVAQAGASCREAIRQAQALRRTRDTPPPPDTTSPYCQARSSLPLDRLQEIHDGLVSQAEATLVPKDLWCGHRVLVADGSTLTAPDTAQNQRAFPQQRSQKPGCGFPIMRLVGLLNLATGMLNAWATANLHVHEIPLLQSLWDHLRPGDVLLADRGFCSWGLLAQCRQHQLHAVLRVKGSRRGTLRRGTRLSPNERLVQWPKPKERAWTLSARQWALLPQVLTLRLVRCRLQLRGFRTRQVLLVTTLLDSTQYPPSALSQLYLRRWTMELTLRNIKTTLQMDYLSCKSPDNLEREIRMHFLVHNLVRRLMLEAARRHRVALERISFAGSLAAARRYGEALLQTRSACQRTRLRQELFRVLAADLLPNRPGRREPRAVKRRPKAYPLLMCHRHRFREIQHQNRYSTSKAAGSIPRKFLGP